MLCRTGGAQGIPGVAGGAQGFPSSMSSPRKDQSSCAAPTARQQQEMSGFSPITENSSKICGLELPGKEHTTLNILL